MEERKFREKPFAWQEKEVVWKIQKNFHQKNKAPALALYVVLTEIASNQGSESQLNCKLIYLKKKTGLGWKKLKYLLKQFRKLKLIKSKQGRTKEGKFGDIIITLLATERHLDKSTEGHLGTTEGYLEGRTEGYLKEKTATVGSDTDLRLADLRSQDTIEDNIVIENNIKKKRSSFKKDLITSYKKEVKERIKGPRPFYKGDPMRWVESEKKWYVIKDGEWLEFAGSEKDIEWSNPHLSLKE